MVTGDRTSLNSCASKAWGKVQNMALKVINPARNAGEVGNPQNGRIGRDWDDLR